MNKQFFILLLLALAAYGQQQKRIAIVNTEDDGEPPIKISELTHLTDRLREIANKTLPPKSYAVMTQQSILAFLGSQENMIKECKAAESCLAKLGRKINADYIGQARIGRFGKDLTIKVEIYESGNGNLMNSFTGMSKEIYGLLSVLEKEAPALFKQLPNASDGDPSTTSPTVALTPTLIPAPAPAQLIVTEYGQQLTDNRDGKKYRVVVIGKQTWMAENLDYGGKKDDIGRCFGEKSENCKKYGTLYAYDEAVRVCPSGWHLPSNREWRTLVDFAGGTGMAAKKLKARNWWSEPNCRYITEETTGRGKVITTEHNECATDEFGFSALPTPGGGSSEKREYDSSEFWDSNWWNSNGGVVEINGIVDPYAQGAIVRSEVSYIDDALDFYPDTYVRCVQGTGNEKAATTAVATTKETKPAPQTETIKPSFNCAKATTSQEKAICSNADLAELDNRLAKAYSKASPACKKGQKEWLNERDSCSASISCLKNSYKTRINELENCR